MTSTAQKTDAEVGYEWKPIEPLSDKDRSIDLAAIRPLYDTWNAAQHQLLQSSKISLDEFNKRLVRALSIETGIIERIYSLDRGTTEVLVAHGFVEDLVSHNATNIPPSHLIDILRDQEAAITLVMDCIARKRSISKGLMHELHAILMRHQDSTTAVDQFGVRNEIRLLKGKFKEQRNNPKRTDGTIHQYCPPEHVETEIESLIKFYATYAKNKEDPIIVSAWFHHRFTQIHPYQDGNGRLARALTTLILMQNDLLPLVIDRDHRQKYIEALETADKGDISKLASMFAERERDAIMRAISVDTDKEKEIASRKTLTTEVIGSLDEKITKKLQQQKTELRSVNNVAQALQKQTNVELKKHFENLKKPLSKVATPEVKFMNGGPDQDNAYWYRSDVIETAKKVGKSANFYEDHYFVRATIRVKKERLIFVTSFHHVGRELSGIMETTAFARLESEDGTSVSQNFYVCSMEPFVFTYKTKTEDIVTAFNQWLDEAVALAIKEFGDRLL